MKSVAAAQASEIGCRFEGYNNPVGAQRRIQTERLFRAIRQTTES
jgi:hypothetical protein